VIEVNRKVLVIFVVLMECAMWATPVLAIGPTNAAEVGNNPNLVMRGYGPSLKTPSGMVNEWVVNGPPIPEHDMFMDARDFTRGNAFAVTSPSQVSVNPNKWLYLNQQMFAIMLAIWHIPPNVIPIIVAQNPQGIYYKWNTAGK
jgi:hypothetical protein